jgi:two-component system phosphate regulon sensor histidine kinase PhoR
VILAIISLFAAQVFWFRQQFESNKEQLDLKIKEALHQCAQKLKDRNYCFQLYTRAYIKAGEGFVILQPKFHPSDKADTIGLYYSGFADVEDGKMNGLSFSDNVTADINIKFEFHLNDSAAFNEESDLLSQTNPKNIKKFFSISSPVFKVFDTTYVDSVLVNEFRKQGIPEMKGFGLLQMANDSLAYLSPGSSKYELTNSRHRIVLNDDVVFSQPYELIVELKEGGKVLPVKMAKIFGFSAFIFIVLISGFWYFLSTIRKQKKLSDMKNDFIDNMTHEFNTPISNIGLATETLVKTGFRDQEQNSKYLSIINNETDRLSQNMNRILQLAQAEKGKLLLQPEPIHLHQLLNNVIHTFELKADLGKIKLYTSFNSTKDRISADETHLINVYLNIIDNAIKYCAGNSCSVTIETFQEQEYITTLISDNGQGMSKEVLEKIFDKFYRGQSLNQHDVKGFGLGLSYAKRIVELHNGKISASSTPGKGTKIKIQLPLIP